MQVDSHCSDFFLSVLIFRFYSGLMGVHLTHSMGAVQSRVPNVNQDGQGRKGRKGKDTVKKFCLFATVDYERGIEKDFSLKKPPHCSSPSPFTHAGMK